MILKSKRTARQAILSGIALLITVGCDHGKMEGPAARPEEIDQPGGAGASSGEAAPVAAGGSNAAPMGAPGAGPMGGPGAGPMAGAAGAGGPAAGSSSQEGAYISGTITLSPELQSKVQPGSVVFIIARMPGVDKGPPMATTRLPADKFPLEFRLGPENVMMQGMPFQGKVSLSARLDGDGNAMTKNPGDVAGAMPAPVEVGDHAVKLELNQPL